jgi:hypothetical protein
VRSEVGTYGRFLVGLRRHLRDQVGPADCRKRLDELLAGRDEAFLRILERGVYAKKGSPYRRLLEHAGIELGDAARLVRDEGAEAALSRLHEEGVYVTLDEFKCRRPIVRPGLELPVRVEDFDNPLLTEHYELRSGGSRSAGRRTKLDLGLLADDAAHHWHLHDAFGVVDRPWAVWHTVPPGGIGIKMCLVLAKLGNPAERWFTPTEPAPRGAPLRFQAFTRSTVALSRLWGHRVPPPEHTPPAEAVRAARWLASKRAGGTPAALSTSVSLAVRLALAAREHGLDIAGTFFRLHSEPYTPAKAAIIAETGSRAAIGYAMSEVGPVGLGCAAGADLDDVHVLSDKVAILQRDRRLGSNGVRVGALLFTTLLPSCPKLMINADVGDYGRLEKRACGCPIGEAGFPLHLSGIRSYDKLTSEGQTFLGTDLITLLEETLPARFGGHATDYQLVEEERGGLTKVNVVVDPAVGPLDEAELVGTVLSTLRSNPDLRLMAESWRAADAMRVLRREPYVQASKILPLHIPRSR